MVEALIVLIVLLVGFFFFYDFASAAVTRLLMNHGASRAARADAVGFNEFHREKSLRVGMIPVSGRRVVPDGDRTVGGTAGELALIRTYLQAENWSDSYGILDYERWSRLSHKVRHSGDLSEVTVSYEVPELLPWKLARMFGIESSADRRTDTAAEPGWIPLKAKWSIENHADTYLER